MTAVRGGEVSEVNRTLWLLRQVARESGWDLEQQLQACTDYLDIAVDDRPSWGFFLDDRSLKERNRRQVLLTKEGVRGGVVRWMGDYLREVSDEAAPAIRRLRVGDSLVVDGMGITRTA